MKSRFLKSTAAILPLAMLAAPALAQDAGDSNSNNDGAAPAASGNAIIVTANKREQTLLDVAGALAAVSGVELQERGISQAADLQTIVPSLNVGQLRGDTQIAIRGVGLTVTGSAPGVAVHVDGVYQPRPSMGELTQVDLERVEVLRGPQGTLYGRNANGGVINFITKAPTSEFEGYALASYQNYDEYRLQAAVNLPISEAVRLRVTGDRWHRGDSWITNEVADGAELEVGGSWLARAHLEADITPNFKASIIGTYAERDGTFVYFTNVTAPIPEAVIRNPILATANIPLEPMTVAMDDPVDQERRYASVAGILEWDLGDYQIKSTTAYQRFRDDFLGDFDATDISLAPNSTEQLAKTFTQELTVSVSSGPVEAVLGGFYMHDNFMFHLDFEFPNGAWLLGSPPQAIAFPGTGLQQLADPYISETLAFFGDVTVNLSESLRLIGGLRYSNDKQRITQDSYFQFLALPPFLGPQPSPSDDANGRVIATVGGPAARLNITSRQSFDSWTPRAGLQYDLSPTSMVYATFSKGFKVGGFNYRTDIGATYKPEKLTAYEVGTKNEFMDGQLTLNAAGFYYDYKDLQVEQLNGFSFILANAPKARIYGAEIEAIVRPADGVMINGSMTLSNARFKEFTNGDILDGQGGVPQDLSGNPLPNAPDYSANVGFSYETAPVVAGGTLTFRGDLSYKSRIFFREFGNPADSEDGYALINASIQWTSANEGVSVRLFGKNLTDATYKSSSAQTSFVGNRFATWGAPRQYGIELRTNF